MDTNVEVSIPRIKQKSHTRSVVRLAGYMRRRINKSTKPWVCVKIDDFCGLTGLTIRTARRAINAIRNDQESDLVIRTIYENKKWSLLASTTSRLQGLARSEPFEEDGEKKRIVKTSKHGEVVRVEQLKLGEEGIYWGDEPITQCQVVAQPTREDPNQITLNLEPKEEQEVDLSACWKMFLKPDKKEGDSLSDISLVSNKGVFHSEKQSKHRQKAFGDGIHRLAFAIARNYLEPLHYDNCKIEYNLRYAVAYAKKALEDGCSKQAIIRSYDWAVHDCHAMCVDLEPETSAGGWSASSTISRARRLLVARGCHGKWKRISAQKQAVKVIASVNSQ